MGLTVGVGLADAWELVWTASMRHTCNMPMSARAVGSMIDDLVRAWNIADSLDEPLWRRADGLKIACRFTLTRGIGAALRIEMARADAASLPELVALFDRARDLERDWTRLPLRIEATSDYRQGVAAELLGCDPDTLSLVRGGNA